MRKFVEALQAKEAQHMSLQEQVRVSCAELLQCLGTHGHCALSLDPLAHPRMVVCDVLDLWVGWR